ncbi:MAG: ABC-type transport auxiliary lipoprotein family protein [Pseudomonadota bacterium]|nr:ABC-type transport auxiliary lipoprotein family protein [Pseudomonadota bacterium]
MKTIAFNARMFCAKAILPSAALLLSGCALPLPDKPQRPQPYDLGPPLAASASAAALGVPLAVDRVNASVAIDGTAIVYRLMYSEDGRQPRPYAQARWTMSPPQMLTQRLREAMAATRPVVDVGQGLAAVEMQTELEEFAHLFSSPDTSEGVVRLRVTVIAPAAKGQRLLGQRTIVVRAPAASQDAPGGVAALRTATDDAVAQAVQWVNALPAPR